MKPYGYLWYTKHMERRFTHADPTGKDGVIGDVVPVYLAPPEGAARLAILGIERMLESVQEDLRNEDPGNHATIGALRGEGKGLTAAKLLLEGAMRVHHADMVRDLSQPQERKE